MKILLQPSSLLFPDGPTFLAWSFSRQPTALKEMDHRIDLVSFWRAGSGRVDGAWPQRPSAPGASHPQNISTVGFLPYARSPSVRTLGPAQVIVSDI